MRDKPLKEMGKEELEAYAKELETRITIYSMELMSYERQLQELEKEVIFFKSAVMVKCPGCSTFRNKQEVSCSNCLFPLK